MAQVYQSTLLLAIYKCYKYFYKTLTGTTEILRITKRVIKQQQLQLETQDKSQITKLSKQVQLHPDLLYETEQAIFYSSKLDSVRRQFESRYQQFDEPLERLLQIKSFPNNGHFGTSEAIVMHAIMSKIYATFTLMHHLNERAATRYDSTIAGNEKKLENLWKLLMPDEQLTSRYTPQWQKIGFQGKDPATDFRAMGMLGLDDLLYLAKNYPSIASRILAASHHSQSWFSFAIVGISMTAYCLRLVRTRQLQYYFYTCGISENVYHEVYCYMFDAFEKHWSSLSPPPSVLDFNQIFRSFQIQMELQILGRDLPILKESRVLETKKRV